MNLHSSREKEQYKRQIDRQIGRYRQIDKNVMEM